MNKGHDEQIAKLLRQAVPPVNAELPRDLWPQMLRRMDERTVIPWFDWALGGAAALWMCFTPHLIPILLYHL